MGEIFINKEEKMDASEANETNLFRKGTIHFLIHQ